MRYSSPNLIIFTTSLAFVLVQLDVSIINVALATIAGRLATPLAGLQWVVDAYALAFASLLLSAGALSDRFGARRIFLLGLGLFTGASLACGVAPGIASLIVGRIAQGIGAAALVPSSLALLSRACGNDGALRARGVGLWTAAGSVGLAAGPLLGGLLVQWFGWRSIFLVNLPIGALGLWLGMRCLESTPIVRTPVDWKGLAMAVAALASLTACVIEARSPNAIFVGFMAALLLFIGLVAVEQRTPHPMLPLDFFRDRTFSGATAVGFLLNMPLYGLIFVFGLYLQQVHHWSAWASGLAFLPLPVVLGFANVAAKPIGMRLGAPAAMTLGLVLAAAGSAAFEGLGPETPYPAMLIGLVLLPAGIGVAVPLMTASLLGSVPRDRSGVASGMLNAVRQAGGAIGVAGGGALSGHGLATVFLLASALLLIAAAIAAGLIRTAGDLPRSPQPVLVPVSERKQRRAR